MMERIQELSPGQIDKLKQLGQDTLTAISPPVAAMVYGNGPDQLSALQRIGPDALGAMSPKLADMLYGNDNAIDPDNVINPDTAEKKLGRFPGQTPPIIVPPQPDYVIWWAFEDACDTCLENVADDPRPYGTPFSSGDTEPPAHDHCRCSLMSSMRGSCPIRVYSGQRIFELSSRY